VRTTYIGMIEGAQETKRRDWLQEMSALGRQAR
jgi:hypothetical protein